MQRGGERPQRLGETSGARHIAASRVRKTSVRVRRARAVTVLLVVVTGIVIGVQLSTSGGHTPKAASVVQPQNHPTAAAVPAVESGLLPWQLAAPISRVVVLPGTGN